MNEQSRVAIITGSAGGIGTRLLQDLANAGFLVAGLDLHSPSDRPELIACDVTDPDAINDAFQRITNEHGRIDVLINNAGILVESSLEDCDPERWHRTLAVNLSGAYYCTRAALPHLRRSKSACVVNIASQLAFKGAPNTAAYSASKAGLIGLTRALAAELAPSIRVNAIAPGPIATPMIKPFATVEWVADRSRQLALNRLGTPQEVSAAALFLISDAASYFTGQTLHPNGGGVMP